MESNLINGEGKLAKARFAVYGTSLYPDATFTLRLNYGAVKGWVENGKVFLHSPSSEEHSSAPPAASRAPCLRAGWMPRRSSTSRPGSIFVPTNDIIGGNSGSPIINSDGQLVGLAFDRTIHSPGGNCGFDESMNRAVSVHSSAIIEALEKVYGPRRIFDELKAR